jgi:hypothetical protein
MEAADGTALASAGGVGVAVGAGLGAGATGATIRGLGPLVGACAGTVVGTGVDTGVGDWITTAPGLTDVSVTAFSPPPDPLVAANE